MKRHRTDVVFVAVGNDDGFDLVLDDMKVGEIRYKNIYTVHRLIREAHSHIDNDGGCLRFKYCHVTTDLTETAKRCETHFSFGVEVDLFPWGHSGFLNAFVLFNGSTHRFIDGSYILAFAATAFVLVVATVLIVPRFFVLIVLLVGVVASSVLTVSLPFTAVSLSVWVRLSVRVRFSVGVVPLSVLALFRITLSIFTLWSVLSVLPVRVGSSATLGFIPLLCIIAVWRSLPLILRVSAVLTVVFHLNYPLIHYISDDK